MISIFGHKMTQLILRKSSKTDKEIYHNEENYAASISKLHATNRNRVRSIISGALLNLPIAVSLWYESQWYLLSTFMYLTCYEVFQFVQYDLVIRSYLACNYYGSSNSQVIKAKAISISFQVEHAWFNFHKWTLVVRLLTCYRAVSYVPNCKLKYLSVKK